MPKVSFHVHPAIGIARVGPSPDTWYLGPEAQGEPLPPSDGFRDAAGLLKPQAARFRVFARLEEDGKVQWQEVTSEIADLTWSVTLQHRKAEGDTRGIGPGAGVVLQRNHYVFSAAQPTPAATLGASSVAGSAVVAALQGGTTTPPQTVVGSVAFKQPLKNKEIQQAKLLQAYQADGLPSSEQAIEKIAQVLFVADSPGPIGSDVTQAIQLGRLQAEPSGRLLVVGGAGNAGSPLDNVAAVLANDPLQYDNFLSYDDTCDGPVKATIKLKAEVAAGWGLPSVEAEASAAWVVVAPPNFGQVVPPIISALDVLENRLASVGGIKLAGLAPDAVLAAQPVFERDVLPLLQAGYETRWANSKAFGAPSHHKYLSPNAIEMLNYLGPDPVARAAAEKRRIHVLASLIKPFPALPPAFTKKYAAILAAADGLKLANMPLDDNGVVTTLQYAHMVRWAAGDFSLANSAPPQPLPAILDRAALRWVTGIMLPGVEIGPELETVQLAAVAKYESPWLAPLEDRFRLGAAAQPGQLTRDLSVPWQTDFGACIQWAAERPVNVFLSAMLGSPGGLAAAAMKKWSRNAGTMAQMLERWAKLGILRRVATGEVVETERTLPEPGGAAAIDFVDNQTAGIDFGTVRVGMFAGQPVRTFASRFIALTGAPAPVKATVLSFQLDGPTSLTLTPTGWAVVNNTLLSNGSPPTPPDTQAGWQQLFHAVPSIPTANPPALLRVYYGTAVPDIGPIADVWTQATVTVAAEAGNTNKVWTIPIVARTSVEPPAGVAIGIDGTAWMGPGRYQMAKDMAIMLAGLAHAHQQVAVFRFGAKLDTLAVLEVESAAIASKQEQQFKQAIAEPYMPGGDIDLAAAAAYGAGLLVGEGTRPVVLLTRGSTPQAAFDTSGLPADVRLFAVGFDIELGPLSTLTAPTGGYALQVATATGQVAFKLAGLLMTDALELQTVLDPVVVVSSSNPAIVPFPVSSADEAIEVRCYSERAAELDGQILAPNGLVIASDKLDVQRLDGAVVLRFWPARAVDGLFPPSFSTGQWSAWFSRSSASPATSVVRRPTDAAAPVSPVVAQVAVAAASHAQLDVVLLADPADPARALLSVGVRLFGAPVAAADVTVTVHGPIGTSRPDVARRDDAWLASLAAPAAGTYEIHVRVTSWAHDGSEFQREAVRMWSVAAPRR